jgi:hypothetical protein
MATEKSDVVLEDTSTCNKPEDTSEDSNNRSSYSSRKSKSKRDIRCKEYQYPGEPKEIRKRLRLYLTESAKRRGVELTENYVNWMITKKHMRIKLKRDIQASVLTKLVEQEVEHILDSKKVLHNLDVLRNKYLELSESIVNHAYDIDQMEKISNELNFKQSEACNHII